MFDSQPYMLLRTLFFLIIFQIFNFITITFYVKEQVLNEIIFNGKDQNIHATKNIIFQEFRIRI